MPTRSDLPYLNQLTLASMDNGTKAGLQGTQAAYTSQESDKEGKLRQLLQAQAQQGELDKMDQADQIEANKQTRGLGQAQDYMEDNAARGRKVSVNLSGTGGVALSQNEPNPFMQQMKGQAASIQHNYDAYTKALPKLQDKYNAAAAGLEAVNDPKQVGSVGQARSLMLKSLGMNRYNHDEASQVLPPNVLQYADQIFNQGGGDANPLSSAQRASVNQFFMGSLQHTKEAHDALKQTALGGYQVSPFYDASRAQQIQQTMGKPFDSQMSQTLDRYKSAPSTGYNPSVNAAPAMPSAGDRLRSFLGMSPSTPAAPAPQAAPAATAPVAPQTPGLGGSGGLGGNPTGQRTVLKRQVNKQLGKTRTVYSDGSVEETDGIQ